MARLLPGRIGQARESRSERPHRWHVLTNDACALCRSRFRHAIATGVLVLGAMSPIARAQPVQLDVVVKVTDLDNKPLRGIPVRMVLGPAPAWQAPDVGTRFVTDGNGEYRYAASAVLEERMVKRPTNFLSSLVSAKERTRHLRVAAEMPYMNYHWLYVFEIDRFESDGTGMMQAFTLHAKDARGRFTVAAGHDNQGGWSLPELQGMMLTRPGFEPSDYSLQPPAPDPNAGRWTLQIAYKKSSDAVRR